MRAGRLRQRVVLQEPIETRDDHGQPVKSWIDHSTIWAGVEPLRGREKEIAHQIAAEATIRVICRYRNDVTSDWRILADGRILEITAPPLNPDFWGRELHLMCREIK